MEKNKRFDNNSIVFVNFLIIIIMFNNVCDLELVVFIFENMGLNVSGLFFII